MLNDAANERTGRTAVFIIALGLALAPSLASASGRLFSLKDAIVENNPPRPAFGSGIVEVLVEIVVGTRDGASLPVYMIYMGADQFVPKAGDRCQIRYRIGDLDGNVAQTSRNMGSTTRIPNAKIIDSISCGS